MNAVKNAPAKTLDLLRAVQLAIESGRDFHGLPLAQLSEYLLRHSKAIDTVRKMARMADEQNTVPHDGYDVIRDAGWKLLRELGESA